MVAMTWNIPLETCHISVTWLPVGLCYTHRILFRFVLFTCYMSNTARVRLILFMAGRTSRFVSI